MDHEAERNTVRKALHAADNGNHAGEQAILKMAAASELYAALREIVDSHIPDQPAHDAGDELSWAQRHVGTLRLIALRAVRKAGGEA